MSRLVARRVTATLSGVTPCAVVPGEYSPEELARAAGIVLRSVLHGGGRDLDAARVVVTARSWPQRPQFLRMLRHGMAQAEPRRERAEGEASRFAARAACLGLDLPSAAAAEGGAMPWLFAEDVGAGPLGRLPLEIATPGVLAEAALECDMAATFPAEAAAFCRSALGASACAALLLPGSVAKDPFTAFAMEGAPEVLEHGIVGVNCRPDPLGGIPGAPWKPLANGSLAAPGGGIGLARNALQLGGVTRTFVRGPALADPVPPWLTGRGDKVGPALAAFEASPSWAALRRLRKAAR